MLSENNIFVILTFFMYLCIVKCNIFNSMGMLSDFEDKYMMCPIFKHIRNRKPVVGDFIITTYNVGIIQKINEKNEEDIYSYETYDVLIIRNEVSDRISYSDYTYRIYDYESFCIITEELFDMIHNHIPSNMLDKIVSIVNNKEEYDDDPNHGLYSIYMLLYRIYTYLSSIISDEMDKMILLSSGIKKVLKKHKNNGLRDVLLGNGQIWQLKKKKKKGFWGRQIHHRNKKYECLHYNYREKSVSYHPIKRLDKEYEVVIS